MRPKLQQGKNNGIGMAGFILSLFGLLFGPIPIMGWGITITALCISVIGIFKYRKNMAIAGLVISIMDLFFLIFVFNMIPKN